MALLPVSILRSTLVLKENKTKIYVSTTFIAKFQNASHKFLNKKDWISKDLFKKSDEGNVLLSFDNCTLFYKDWSYNPTFSDFYKNYPKSLLTN